MGKKKNKVPKITEEEYYAYVSGLKNEASLFSADGKITVPSPLLIDKERKPKHKDL